MDWAGRIAERKPRWPSGPEKHITVFFAESSTAKGQSSRAGLLLEGTDETKYMHYG